MVFRKESQFQNIWYSAPENGHLNVLFVELKVSQKGKYFSGLECSKVQN
jgi:hypothetical protein